MPLRQFNADVAAAAEKVVAKTIDRITTVQKGDSDGELVITYAHENLPTPLRVRILSQGTFYLDLTAVDRAMMPLSGLEHTSCC